MSIFSKIMEVFTKKYKEETGYLGFLKNNIDRFKLESNDYNIEENIERIRVVNFKSNFKVELGQLSTSSINNHKEQLLNISKEER